MCGAGWHAAVGQRETVAVCRGCVLLGIKFTRLGLAFLQGVLKPPEERLVLMSTPLHRVDCCVQCTSSLHASLVS